MQLNAHNAAYYDKDSDCAVVLGSPEQVARARDFWFQAGNMIQLIETALLINRYNGKPMSSENADHYKEGLREVSSFLIKCCGESERYEQRKMMQKKNDKESVDSAHP